MYTKRIKSIRKIGMRQSYDLNTPKYENFLLDNGILSHNSGKSYTSIRICQLWYQFKFHEPFPIENICFDLKSLALRLRNGNLRKGELLIFEEAGVNINNLEFQNKIQRIFQQVMQSFRSKNIGIIFNLPSIGFMGKGTRVLLHGLFQTKGIDMKEKETLVKPLFVQYNTLYDKTYHKYMRVYSDGLMISVSEMRFKKPSEELLITYEKKKDDFVHSTMDRLIDEMEVQDKKEERIVTKEKEKLSKEELKEQQRLRELQKEQWTEEKWKEVIEDSFLRGNTTPKQLQSDLGTSDYVLRKNNYQFIIQDLKKRLREQEKETQKNVQILPRVKIC